MSIIRKFINIFYKTRRLGYSQIYVAVDIHETILKPTWSIYEHFDYYPNAVDSLRLMSDSDRFRLILWSSCSPEKMNLYKREFEKNRIVFDFLNENPDAHNTDYAYFNDKFYFDIGFDDKFGFNPYIDWFFIKWILKIKKLFKKI